MNYGAFGRSAMLSLVASWRMALMLSQLPFSIISVPLLPLSRLVVQVSAAVPNRPNTLQLSRVLDSKSRRHYAILDGTNMEPSGESLQILVAVKGAGDLATGVIHRLA